MKGIFVILISNIRAINFMVKVIIHFARNSLREIITRSLNDKFIKNFHINSNSVDVIKM